MLIKTYILDLASGKSIRLLLHSQYLIKYVANGNALKAVYFLRQIEEKMRSREEVEKMFEATKKELETIVEADTPRTGLHEDKRLMLNAQLGILSWVLDIEK